MATNPLPLSTFDYADTGAGKALDTGLLRRKYNFGDRVSELSIAQTPFFRFVSKVGKNPTDDPSFKFTERRPSFHKRYSYVVGQHTSVAAAGNTCSEATLSASSTHLFMAGDYKSAGNIQNIQGQATGAISVGDNGTAPDFFLPKQLIKVPMAADGKAISGSAGALVSYVDDYMLYQLDSSYVPVKGYLCLAADAAETGGSGTDGVGVKGDFISAIVAVAGTAARDKWLYCTRIQVSIVKTCIAASPELANYIEASDLALTSVYNESISDLLEKCRSYVVGSAHEEGSALSNKTWNDQPFSTGYGQTQIWRTEFGMTNTARATQLKYEANEWARIWRDKLIEHKWDIEHSLLFGSQASIGDFNYTQGAVDYIQNNGNVFEMGLATKTQDDFLDDLSKLVDPRYGGSESAVFFCSTEVYNWLHKLSGYFSNNIANVQPGGFAPNGTAVAEDGFAAGSAGGSLGRGDFAMVGKSKSFGVDISRISTIYGDMNIARHIMLDGTNVKMLAVDMKHVKYRPLVGNGVSRDTSIYVGVQSLENTGTDKRVDMILTEAGMEFQMPESHAIWK
tara:strand:- start:3721 stop:5415 length:1695 start_codon:yes stop_codon:yes gene_type:complete